MNKQIFLSLIIPCYNEEKRIGKGLEAIIRYLKSQKYTWEIILVNDGSTDKTAALAHKLLKDNSHQLLSYFPNQGKGAAVKRGVLAANGRYIIFTDIDMSTPINQLPKLLASLKTYPVAIGVRRHPNSQVLKHQPLIREFLGQVFTKLTNFLVAPGIYDVTCGFKGFQKGAARKLFTKSKIKRWAFDAEILYLASKHHLSITQIPVRWSNDKRTKVKLALDGLTAFIDLFKIRILH